MTTQFNWSVTAMATVQQPDPDYVVNIQWRLRGADGQVEAYLDGNTHLAVDSANTGFIPYDQLTEALVLNWVFESLGEQGIANAEANVQGQIDAKNNPPVTPQNTPLPWAPLGPEPINPAA